MSLFPRIFLGDLELTDVPYIVLYGRDYGSPATVYEEMVSELATGEDLSSERTSNRELAIPLAIDDADLTTLAEAEARLIAECDKPRNLLRVEPGDGAPAMVFETFRAQVTLEFSDEAEVEGIRTYKVTMPARPHTRSGELVTTPAVAVTPVAVINDGSSTAGWSANNSIVTTSGGAVVSTYDGDAAGAFYGTNMMLDGVVDTSSAHYIAVDWKASIPVYHAFRLNSSVTNLTEARREPLSNGFTRSWYYVGQNSFSRLVFGTVHAAHNGYPTLSIDRVAKAAALPVVGTGRQAARVIEVGGSAPTQGSIEVQHEATSLGEVIVYTDSNGIGYQPPLSPWYDATGPVRTPFAAAVSGAYCNIANPAWALVPASAVPEGEYLLVARVRNESATADVRLNHQVRSWMNGAVVGYDQVGTSGTTTVNLPTNTWKIVTLGAVNLPPTRVGVGGLIQILVHRHPAETQTILMDEFWIYHTAGRLTIVSAPTSKRLSIRAPSLDDPNGSILIGNDPSWADAYSAAHLCTSRAHHDLQPGPNNCFTVTTDAVDAAVSATHFDRFHTHATP